MTLDQKINLTLAIVNSLVFIVMVVALLLQFIAYKQNQTSLNNSQKELRLAILGVKFQVSSIILSQKNYELGQIDKNSSLESQDKYKNLETEIGILKDEIESIRKCIEV